MYEDDYADPNDPYAYDVNGVILKIIFFYLYFSKIIIFNIFQVQDGAYGGYEPANNYDYDIDAPIGNKFNSNAYGKGGDPYADIDMDADINCKKLFIYLFIKFSIINFFNTKRK